MAQVTRIRDQALEIFERVFQQRAAADDQIFFDFGVAHAEDGDGDPMLAMTCFISITDGAQDGPVYSCVSHSPMVYFTSATITEIVANRLWDLVQGQRMGHQLEAMFGPEDLGSPSA